MMKLFLMLVLVVFVLTSCSKKLVPLVGYSQINKKINAPYIGTLVVDHADLVPLNIDHEFRLTLNDSVLVYNDTIYSNYKAFSFKASASKRYKISIYSLCDCFGFEKYLLNPEIKIVSNSSSAVSRSDSSYFGYQKGPLSLNKIWTVQPNVDGDCNLLLYSNNEALQKDIYKWVSHNIIYTGGIFVPLVIPISVKSTLIGRFIFRIDEK